MENGRLVGDVETSGEFVEWPRVQPKKLVQTKPAKKESVATVPPSELMARTPELLLPKGKGTEPSVQITRS